MIPDVNEDYVCVIELEKKYSCKCQISKIIAISVERKEGTAPQIL